MSGVSIYRVDAPLIFANVDLVLDDVNTKLARLTTAPQVFIFDFESVGEIDTTGIDALVRLHDTLDTRGGALVLARVHASVQRYLDSDGTLAGTLAGTCPTVAAAAEACAGSGSP